MWAPTGLLALGGVRQTRECWPRGELLIVKLVLRLADGLTKIRLLRVGPVMPQMGGGGLFVPAEGRVTNWELQYHRI